jgi:DNA repair exonuclease SbcCD nuclease subunit
MRKNQLESWPSNVHVFSEPGFETKQFEALDGLHVSGCAYQGDRNRSTFPDTDAVLNRSPRVDLLLLHGVLDASDPSSGDDVFSFSEQVVREVPARYVAMGHTHQYREVRDEGTIRGAFAGSPMGMHGSETGERSILIGELTEEGVPASSLEKRSVSPRRLFELEIEQESDISAPRFRRRVQERFDEEGVRTEDLVYLRIHGADPGREVLGSKVLQSFLGTYFHVQLDASRTRPLLDAEVGIEGEQSGTTEDQFVREMLDRLDEASSEEQKEIVLKALRMGRSAFRTEDVNLDHVL